MTEKFSQFPGGKYAPGMVMLGPDGRPLTPGAVIDSSGKYSFDIASLPAAFTYDGAGNVLTQTYGPDRNGRTVKRTKTWAGNLLSSDSAFALTSADATALTLTGPASGVIGAASADFTVAVTPIGGAVSDTIVVKPSDNGANGIFTPESISLTFASPTAKFKYTPALAGNKTISISNDGGLAKPGSLTFTASMPSSDVAPSVLTQAAITGTPQEGVALSIIGATFGGSPTPTVARVIRMDGVQVASGDQTTGYTPPVGASAGRVPSVTETASNGVGQAASSTATGAAVVAGAAQSLAASETWEIPSAVTSNAARTALLSSTRTFMSIANPATNLQTMEYALVDQPNFNRNVPSAGWVELPPGAQDNITDADAKKQMFTRVRASDTKPVTAATCNGTTATYTVPNHGLTGSSNVRGFEGITPAGYNIRNVLVTVVDPNTLTTTILTTQTAATAFGVMLNCQETVITRRLEPK